VARALDTRAVQELARAGTQLYGLVAQHGDDLDRLTPDLDAGSLTGGLLPGAVAVERGQHVLLRDSRGLPDA